MKTGIDVAQSNQLRAAENSIEELARLRVEMEALRPKPPYQVKERIERYLEGRKEDIQVYLDGYRADMEQTERRLQRLTEAHPNTRFLSDDEAEDAEPSTLQEQADVSGRPSPNRPGSQPMQE